MSAKTNIIMIDDKVKVYFLISEMYSRGITLSYDYSTKIQKVS